MDVEDLEVWTLADDIDSTSLDSQPIKARKKKDWEPHFISEGFFDAQEQPNIEDYLLKDRKLRMLGQRVTMAR